MMLRKIWQIGTQILWRFWEFRSQRKKKESIFKRTKNSIRRKKCRRKPKTTTKTTTTEKKTLSRVENKSRYILLAIIICYWAGCMDAPMLVFMFMFSPKQQLVHSNTLLNINLRQNIGCLTVAGQQKHPYFTYFGECVDLSAAGSHWFHDFISFWLGIYTIWRMCVDSLKNPYLKWHSCDKRQWQINLQIFIIVVVVVTFLIIISYIPVKTIWIWA